MSHVGDWPKNGERRLEYNVAVRTFTGDWYAAAELYRQWSLNQPWAQKPLHRRSDVPAWLLDSPPHIIIQAAGLTDLGPGDPNLQFLPYSKLVPLLDTISNRAGAPVVALLMSWERPGPWVYPDSFPPVGGEQSFREFAQLARDREWHVGSYANGTRWVIAQLWTGYDGEKYFEEHRGAKTVCRTHEGQGWRDNWDWSWRPSYACCLGVPMTREIAIRFVKHLVDGGLDWIQFLDQNVGCATFPCYASDHGHPPLPGRWMTLGMQALLDAFRKLAAEAEEQSQGKRKLAFSVERPPNEYFMPNFQICDARVRPPGHPGYEKQFIPLYHFLYHDFVLIHGGFAFAPMPYNMPIRSAYNLVVGEIPGGVLTGDGRLLNKDTEDYGPWEPAYGNFEDDLAMLRTTSALRRGKAKNFLVYGRMQSPPRLSGIKTIEWRWENTFYQVPAVFHGAWQSPEELFGIVLANWTKDSQPVSIMDGRLGERVLISVSSDELKSQTSLLKSGQFEISLPPLSCALVEAA
jgi:hypothetical protein